MNLFLITEEATIEPNRLIIMSYNAWPINKNHNLYLKTKKPTKWTCSLDQNAIKEQENMLKWQNNSNLDKPINKQKNSV